MHLLPPLYAHRHAHTHERACIHSRFALPWRFVCAGALPPPLLASTSEDGAARLWASVGDPEGGDSSGGAGLAEPLAELQAPVPCRVCTRVPLPPAPSLRARPASAPRPPHPQGKRWVGGSGGSGKPWVSPAGLPPCSTRGSQEGEAKPAAWGRLVGLRLLAGYADGSLRLFAGVQGGGGGAAGELGEGEGGGGGGAVMVWRSARHRAPVVAVAAHPLGKLALSASRWGSREWRADARGLRLCRHTFGDDVCAL